MNFKTFIQRLNWRQIAIHFIATWFFIFAFQQFAFLINTKLYDAIKAWHSSDNSRLTDLYKELTPHEFYRYISYTSSAWLVGLCIAFIVSLTISKKKKWFWANSLLVFIISFILARQDYLNGTFFKKILLKPGHLFENTTAYLLTNGLVLLSLGFFVFLFKKFNDFIDKKV